MEPSQTRSTNTLLVLPKQTNSFKTLCYPLVALICISASVSDSVQARPMLSSDKLLLSMGKRKVGQSRFRLKMENHRHGYSKVSQVRRERKRSNFALF